MRKLIVAVVLILILVVGAIVFAFVNINALLEENRDRLAGIASSAIGREVEFSKAEVAFSGGLAIKVDGLRVAEDAKFGTGDFIALDSALVGVDLWPALQRRLEVTGVRLDRPTIRVIQTASGFNFSTLGGSGDAAATASDGEAGGEDLALAVAAFEISDGTVLFEDRTANPPLALTILDFQSSGTDLSLENPVSIDFSGLVKPTRGDERLSSRVRGNLSLEDLETQAGRLQVESPSFHPALLGLDFEDGDALEKMDDLDLDVGLPAKGDTSGYPIALVSSAGRLSGFDYRDLDTKLRYRGSTAEIKKLVIDLAGGNVELEGDMTFGPKGRSPFHLKTKLADIDSGELAAILLEWPRGYITGDIDGDIVLSGKSLDWDTLKRSLAGQIKLDVGEGALENVNLVNTIVERLIKDPGFGQLAANTIREVIPQSLQGDRTPFRDINLALDVADGKLTLKDLNLVAGEFLLSAVGIFGLDGSVAGDGKLRFSRDVSAKILKKADRLAPLLGNGDIVELPLLLGGSLSSPRINPNLAALVSNASAVAGQELTKEAQKRATNLLSDVLFGKRKDPAAETTTPPADGTTSPAEAGGDSGAAGAAAPAEGEATPDPAESTPSPKDQQRDAAEQLINEGIGKLFGK